MTHNNELLFENPDLERKITALICVYSVDVCEREIDETHAHYETHREFLVVCLRFHAGQSSCEWHGEWHWDGLIQHLQEGRSPVDGTCLGGNPLRDCVLAVAMLSRDGKAVVVFEGDYFGYLNGIAWRVHPTFGKDPDDWWNEFLDFLAGYSHANGKLKKYQGKSALRPWLRVVLWNFLRR